MGFRNTQALAFVPLSGGTMTGNLSLQNTKRIFFDADGTANDSVYGPSDGEIRFVVTNTNNLSLFGNRIATHVRLANDSAALNLGTAASTSHSLVAGDVIAGGALEVNGVLYADNQTVFDNTVTVNDSKTVRWGSAGDTMITYSTANTPDTWVFGVSADSRALLIQEFADVGTDMGHALQANPTVFVHSADATNTAQWLSLTHDQTNAVISSGAGAVKVGTKLAYTQATIAADDTTPDVSGGNIFTTSANTTPTAITDLDNPTPGQIVVLVGGSSTDATTIADSGNFRLSAAITLNAGTTLTLLVVADNDYVELARSVN